MQRIVGIGLLLIFGASFINFANCDTPANCTYEDAKGTWTFLLSKKHLHYSPSMGLPKTFNVSEKYMVKLMYPDKAIDQFGNIGFWTMVYNQGFEVVVNNRKFFGFFRYIGNLTHAVSICNETLTGYTHDVLQRNWALFKGMKREKVNWKFSFRNIRSTENLLYQKSDDYINQINNAQNMWTAKHYPEYEKMTIKQLSRRAGQKVDIKSVPRAKRPSAERANLAASMPNSFDWRNIDGVNYVSPVRSQGACGSCYSFASAGALESRFLVKTNKTVNVVLSPQDVVECSPYSQGCSGGFPYLIAGKYAEDFGMAAESCNPYKGKDGKCHTKTNCKRYYGTNYKYVGGYYGACNEMEMKLALIHGGPLAIGFFVYSDFHHYSGGIYKHTGLQDRFNPFEITNHAVLLVGYGTEAATGVKYWIVKNSWGESWGEKGYFRILRGVDECGIESMAVSTDPVV